MGQLSEESRKALQCCQQTKQLHPACSLEILCDPTLIRAARQTPWQLDYLVHAEAALRIFYGSSKPRTQGAICQTSSHHCSQEQSCSE